MSDSVSVRGGLSVLFSSHPASHKYLQGCFSRGETALLHCERYGDLPIDIESLEPHGAHNELYLGQAEEIPGDSWVIKAVIALTDEEFDRFIAQEPLLKEMKCRRNIDGTYSPTTREGTLSIKFTD